MITIPIIYTDDDIIVINKPPGISVHGGATVGEETVADILLKDFPELENVGEDPRRPGIVHRLDKNTSGVMVIARTKTAFSVLKNAFKERKVEKIYIALVCGVLKKPHGRIDAPIGRLVTNPLKRGVEDGKRRIRGARRAITEYRVLGGDTPYSVVELKPQTGRMHQLRVHLSSMHHPIACDVVYGGKQVCCPDGAKRQLLHAQSIAFSMREGQRLQFEAELPEYMRFMVQRILEKPSQKENE